MLRTLFESISQMIRRLPAWVLLALTLVLTFSAAYLIYTKTEAERMARVNSATNRAVDTITDRMTNYLNALRHTRSFFLAEEEIPTREEFTLFISSFEFSKGYPGILGVVYAPAVKGADQRAFEKKIQDSGHVSYSVWPESESEIRFPVMYVEPSGGSNQRALGFDMYTEESRRLAMERAIKTGAPSMTGVIDLFDDEEAKERKGFVIYLPLFERDRPLATEEQRREALRGFVLSPVAAEDFFTDILSALSSRGEMLAFNVYEGKTLEAKNALFAATEGGESQAHSVYAVNFAGQDWSISVRPMDQSEYSASYWSLLFILSFGTFIALVVYFYAGKAEERARSLEKSDNQMRLIITSIPHFLAYIDKSEKFLFHNSALLSLLPTETPQEWQGRSMLEILGRDFYSRVESYLKKALSGQPISFETYLDQLNGMRELHVRFIPDHSSHGKVRGVIVLASDISERRKSERQIQDERKISETVSGVGLSLRAEMNLEDLVEKITDTATFLSNARVGAFYYNQVDQKEVEGYQLVAASGAPLAAFESFPTPTESAVFVPVATGRGIVRFNNLSEVEGFSEKLPSMEVGGKTIALKSYMAVPVVSRSGVVFGTLVFAHPEPGVFTQRSEKLIEGIAAQAAVAIDNAKLYHDAQTLNRMKDEFVATLSHELRTPLNVILGHAEILKFEGKEYSHWKASLDAIYRNAVAQNQIISDLLDISAVVNGKLAFKPVRILIGDIVRGAVDGLKDTAKERELLLSYVNDAPNCSMIADATRIQQVVWNLIANSIKFTPAGGEIVVRLASDEEQVLIHVKDTGLGIHSEFLPHIFERFRQEDASPTRSVGGLGLGLAIVRHLVELHGGNVSAKSAGKGQGAEFLVCLPMRALELPLAKASSAGDSVAKAGLAAGAEMAQDISGVKLLAVDDDSDARALLSLILTRAKTDFKICASADEALESLSSLDFDAIISDIGMPEKDGFTFMQEVRSMETERASFTPAIALTAFAREEEAKRAFAAGYQVHLAKPVDTRALISAIHGLVKS